MIIFETDRLILREMTEEDYEAIYAFLADPDVMKYYPHTFDEEKVKNWIKKY